MASSEHVCEGGEGVHDVERPAALGPRVAEKSIEQLVDALLQHRLQGADALAGEEGVEGTAAQPVVVVVEGEPEAASRRATKASN